MTGDSATSVGAALIVLHLVLDAVDNKAPEWLARRWRFLQSYAAPSPRARPPAPEIVSRGRRAPSTSLPRRFDRAWIVAVLPSEQATIRRTRTRRRLDR